MEILSSTPADIDEIFRLYKLASEYQAALGAPAVWPQFERELVVREVQETRQWKMLLDNEIACVWATTFDDPQIWEEKNSDPAVYIHRIATNPKFRGQNLVVEIIEWAKQYALENNKKFVRLDTIGGNKGLIAHYTKCGFNFLGLLKLQNTTGLPSHYHNAVVSLFEVPVEPAVA